MDFFSEAIELAKLYYTTGVRWVFMILALYILVRQIRSLILARNPSEIWAYLGCPDGTSVPLTHWENLIGRGKGCDVVINLNSVSRSHGTLIRDSEGIWKYNDLLSKNGSKINGNYVQGPTEVGAGDVLTIGGSDFTLYPVSLQERMQNIEKRKRRTKNLPPWSSLVDITIFQLLTVIQFKVSLGDEFPPGLIPAFALLCGTMWIYTIAMRKMKRVGFEMETIAFFLSTLSLAVTTSAYPSTVFKQAVTVVIGVMLFIGLCYLLRDLNRIKKLTYIMMGVSVLLLFVNITMGTLKYGATNWVSIGGFSFQPSEMVKIVFIFVGAATLDELQKKKNMLIFLGFSVFCLGCLAVMGDFGTAMIFFVTFLVISFLRSGDFTRLLLVVGAAGLMGMMVLRFKPYIASRFATWGHVWDDPTGGGYQQVQAMCSAASGGIPGLGAGNGTLSDVGAAPTDLVFCLVAEEWGLIIALLSVICIVTLGVFAVRSIIAGRSTYYSIAACGAMSMFIFQTILNVFGTVDLFPLTGVTFPFVSSGGTSMIASWGMLAFLKAADTRQNASFAIKLDNKKDYDNEMASGNANVQTAEDILNDINSGGSTSQKNKFPIRKKSSKDNQTTYMQPIPGAESMEEINHPPRQEAKNPRPQRVKYQDLSDDDFFNNFDDIRPGQPLGSDKKSPKRGSFEEAYERVAPQRQVRKAADNKETVRTPRPAGQQRRSDTQVRAGAQRQGAAGGQAGAAQRKPASAQQGKSGAAGRSAGAAYERGQGQVPERTMSQEERIRRQRQYEEARRRREEAAKKEALNRRKSEALKAEARKREEVKGRTKEEERPLTLEDLFGDDYK